MNAVAENTVPHQEWLEAWRERVVHPDAPTWLTELREYGWGRFEMFGFPNQRAEHWKYTRVSALETSVFAPADLSIDIATAQAQVEQLGLAAEDRIVLVNGVVRDELSQLPSVKGYVGSFADLLRNDPDRVRAFLGAIKRNHHVENPDRNNLRGEPFAALNSACAIDGAAVVLDPNAALEAPLHIVHMYTDAGSMPRNLFLLGQSAEAKVVEWQISLSDEPVFANAITEIGLGENAQLKHERVQNFNNQSWFIETVCTDIHKHARYFGNEYALGSKLARVDTLVDLKAPGSETHLNGMYLPFGTQHIDCHTRIRHQAADCISRQLYKGVADKRGRGVFNGRVEVARDAQRTDSEMQNRNILLSKFAEIDAKPELEIYADDVSCAHGSTIGQLDQTAMFYLRSRGLAKEQAEAILTWAFAAEVVETTDHDIVRSYLLDALAQRLPGGDKIRSLDSDLEAGE
jgi:Fe-S cluster assembly protein SufD